MVLGAARGSAPGAREAFGELCRVYWAPLYLFARRLGRGREEAEDLTQAFFCRLLEKNALSAAEPARGRFRSFLLTSFRHFMSDEYDRRRAAKRGGRHRVVGLEVDALEKRIPRALIDEHTPEHLFVRQWALAVLEAALDGRALGQAGLDLQGEFDPGAWQGR